ncbi:MAG: response regulator transcription factor [Verrucomicrobia subdivision 3 bacterium]|nr:response regulator transcription factor [Limisphaerales bacterium]
MDITVSIVEDDDGLRETLARYLDTRGFRCVSTYGSAEEALRDLPLVKPAVILMDINLPRKSGIECVAQLKSSTPSSKCIILTAFEDTELIFQALAAGALGYLLKGVRPAKLLESIREVHEGGSPMSSQIARKVVAFFQKPRPQAPADAQLSERERQVLECLVKGLLYKQIAAQMGISMGTVRTYTQRIYEKFHVHTRTEAVVKYLRH